MADDSDMDDLPTLDEGISSELDGQQAVAAGGMPGQGGPGQQVRPQQLKPEDFKHFSTIYPCYIDADLTSGEGRRLPQSKLQGCNGVIIEDLFFALQKVMYENEPLRKLKAVVEGNKRHPRSDFMRNGPGRLRIEFKDKSGTALTTLKKEDFMVLLAKAIPELPQRKQRLQAIEQRKKEWEEARAKMGPKKQSATKKAEKPKKK